MFYSVLVIFKDDNIFIRRYKFDVYRCLIVFDEMKEIVESWKIIKSFVMLMNDVLGNFYFLLVLLCFCKFWY